MQHQFIALLVIAFVIPVFCFAQNDLEESYSYDVHRNYPYITNTKADIKAAQTLMDLNKHYKPEWVKEYLAVEVSASHKGKTKKATSKNHTLSQEQIDLMYQADSGTNISVNVKYLPDNNLKHNDIKEENFTFMLEPETDASFVGGQAALQQYLKEKGIDQIAKDKFKQYQLFTVIFNIDEEGRIVDPHLHWPSKDEELDKILLETICNMPNWTPASYTDGTKVKQEFVLTVGDMQSCVVNMFNIKGYGVAGGE